MAWDLFSGPNAPVGAALVWCGWTVYPCDLIFGDEFDLANAEVQDSIRAQIREADACFWAPECSTFSRAREKRLPVPGGGPPVLRNKQFIHGMPNLCGKDRVKVEVANRFTQFTLRETLEGVLAGKCQVIENPAGSLLWDFPEFDMLRSCSGWHEVK